jgi:hypothetical protein
VGGSTAAVMIGNALVPGLADRYLARTGYDSQQTDEPQPPRADNLFEPLPGDRGAHGRFDAKAHAHSGQWALTRHRRALATAALTTSVAGGLAGAKLADGARGAVPDTAMRLWRKMRR